MEINKIYCDDCLNIIKEMENNNIIPQLIICDPPYEFSINGGGLYNQKDLMQNIKDIGTNSFDFYKYIPHIITLQKNKINAYFFCNKELIFNYLKLAKETGCNYDILVLQKQNPIPAHKSSYEPEIEYIIYMRSPGVTFNGNLKSSSIYKKVYKVIIGHSDLKHPNEKPLNLIEKFVKVSSNEGDLICDFFAGSGTTLKAAKYNKRNFIGVEINKDIFTKTQRDLFTNKHNSIMDFEVRNE